MHNVWLIARREYLERVRTRFFAVTTVMIPVIMAALIFGSIFLGERASVDRHIVIVATDLELAGALQSELQKHPDAGDEPGAAIAMHSAHVPHFNVDVMEARPGLRTRLDRDLDDNELDGYLWINRPAAPRAQPTFTYTPRTSSDDATRAAVAASLNHVLLRQQLAHDGVAAGAMPAPVEMQASHESRHQDRASFMISIGALFFLMYLVIMLYGMNVARSIIEEKTSRIFEVMLAAVRPEEMMAGKILGVGAVGLTQVAIWLTAVLIAAGSSAGINLGGETIHPELTLSQLIYFFIYFLLGYLFYSSIAAALGAMTNSEQELQPMNIFVMLPLLACFAAVGPVIATPDTTLARVLSFIPPFTPLLMYARVSLGHPAAWEIAFSIALLCGCIFALVWITSRIYRVGVLMYGKRPSIPELLRWLKYS